jgi:hypothetical protein
MPRAAIAAAVFVAALLTGVWSHPAAAMGPAAPAALAAAARAGTRVQAIHDVRRWRQRHYWRWDHRPVWDDPWEVLQPTIWGSPEPHYVPADVWARKWHLGHLHHWARRRDPRGFERHMLEKLMRNFVATAAAAAALFALMPAINAAAMPAAPAPAAANLVHKAQVLAQVFCGPYGCGHIHYGPRRYGWRWGHWGYNYRPACPTGYYYECRRGPLGYGQCACWPYRPY